jgi:hypothetical protein
MRDTARKLVMRLTVGNVRLAGSNPAILTLGRCVLCRSGHLRTMTALTN